MKQYRIEQPTVKTVPLRRCEPGLTLAKDVQNRDGQLLVKEDQELSEALLSRLNRFNVRRLPVHAVEERWVTKQELDGIPGGDLEILEERTVDDQSPERELVERKSPRELQDVLERLEKASAGEGTDEDISRILRGLYQTRDRTESLLEEAEEQAISADVRGELTDLLEGRSQLPGKDAFDSEIPESLLLDALEIVERREGLRMEGLDEVEGLNQSVRETYQEERAGRGPGNTEEDLRQGRFFSVLQRLKKDAGSIDNDDLESMMSEFTRENDHRDGLKKRISRMVDDEETAGELLRLIKGISEQSLEDIETEDRHAGLVEEIRDFLGEGQQRRSTVEQWCEEEQGNVTDEREGTDPSMATPEPVAGDVEGEEDELSFEAPAVFDSSTPTLNDSESALSVIDQVEETMDDPSESKARLKGHQARLRDADQEREAWKERVGEEMEEGETRDHLLDLLDGELSDKVETLDIDAFDPGQVESLLESTLENHRSQLSLYEEVKTMLGCSGVEFSDGFLEYLETSLQPYRHRLQIKNLEKLQMMVRDGTEDNRSERSMDRERVKKLNDAIDRSDVEGISRYSDVPVKIVETAQVLYSPPKNGELSTDELLEQTRTIVEDVFYRGQFVDEHLTSLFETISDQFLGSNRLYKYLHTGAGEKNILLLHALNNCLVSYLIGDELGLDEEALRSLGGSALTVDLGMSALPESMIFYGDDLTPRARREYMKHPLYSGKLVGRAGGASPEMEEWVIDHHERLDGSGFPKGDTEFHSPEAIVQVADCYTRKIEEWPGTPAMTPPEAMETMVERRSEFGDEAIDVLQETIGYYPNGTIVLTSDGRVGMVKKQTDQPENPRLMLITDQQRNRLSSPEPMDLSRVGTKVKRFLR